MKDFVQFLGGFLLIAIVICIPATENSDSSNPVQMRRELGLYSTTNLIIGVMIGSGIFITPASALQYSGSFGLCIIVWSVSGIISLFAALSFAELGTLIPQSGSEYVFYMKSFGPLHKFWGNLPSFIYSFILVLILRPAVAAVIILTFSKYLCQPILKAYCITDEDTTEMATKLIALVALALITYINASSVKLYVKVQNIFSCFKVIACLIVIGGGIYEIAIGNTENLSTGFQGTTSSPKDLALAFYNGLWAYSGWAMVTTVTEEIKRPEVNIVRSVFLAVPIVTILYVFMNIAYMTVLTKEEMISAQAVAVDFGDRVLGSYSVIIPIGVAFSTFSCAMGLQFGVTRICYVSGKDGLMMESLSYVHHKKLTPAPAVVLQGIITFIFIIIGNISQLIQFASFLFWIFYGFAMVSLLILRKTMKDVYRPLKVPVIIPIFIIIIALYLSLTPIIMDPTPKFLIAVGFILIGIPLYYWFVYKNKRPSRFMDGLTYYIQLLFEAVPSENIEKNDNIENTGKSDNIKIS